MNCAVHTDTPATAFCRTCGKALCENCKRDVMGAIYCEPCIAARLHGAPAATVQGAAAAPGVIPVAAQTPSGAPSPAIAMLLGFIPGVGAMYNGQFVKAFVHVVIFVLLIAAANNISDAFGFAIAFFVFYMAFDAYKTAQAKLLGLPLPDPLGIDRIFGIQEHGPQPTRPAVVAPTTTASAAVPPAANVPSMSAPADAQVVAPPPPAQEATPTGAIVLIALGVLFLLGNFGMFSMHRLWPLFLIGLGLWIAYRRTVERC